MAGGGMKASVVISTFNRADALEPTLRALADQDLPASDYEVLVVDDGSSDATPQVLAAISVPYRLRLFRLPVNSGVSAGRNVGLREAEGDLVIMLSDDLIVPRDFISAHIGTHARFPNSWVVGGFGQLEELTHTPFGRYLDALERQFDDARMGPRIDGDIFEMDVPTARNLSLHRSDLDRVGLFDEQFRITCEDQDLAHRATQHGIRFIYNGALECVHNDQAADLARYCRFQRRGARDTVRLLRKLPQVHGGAPIARVNGYVSRSDGPALIARKALKRVLSTDCGLALGARAIAIAERLRLPDRWLAVGYRGLIGLHTFRGWREGLREAS
jgi:GT2 family glycosyltransferase